MFVLYVSCEKEPPRDWLSGYAGQQEEEAREYELPPLIISIDTGAVSTSDTIKIYL
ncbi:MAG: hypothetical protein LUG96_13190 [Tannerellaceae bacterium]|nr:hypothetical protein [Tannerellaceae bacterium]MCD7916112.1 hypothetical protein [Tannerellaceae bacterium]